MDEPAVSTDLQKPVATSEYVKMLSLSHEREDLSMPINFPFEMLDELKIHLVTARHVPLKFPASTYCSGYLPPTLQDLKERATLILPGTNSIILQRFVQCMQLYGVQEN